MLPIRIVLLAALGLVAHPGQARFLSVDPVTVEESGDQRHFNRYAYAYDNPYRFTDPDGRCPQCLWGIPIGAGTNLTVQLLGAQGSFNQRWSQVDWRQVGVAGVAGGLSGGVSVIASTAATTSGVLAANIVGNAAIGAVATHASAQVEGRAATVGDVLTGAAWSGAASGAGAAVQAVPGLAARSASAGMSQTERTATANLLESIRHATPDFSYSSSTQTMANAAGTGIGASSGAASLLDKETDK